MTGATAVHFGSALGTGITGNTATGLTVTAPAGTGTVDVTVTTPNGTSATNAGDQFTYNAAPTVTAVTPNNGPQAGGNSVTVTRHRLHRCHGRPLRRYPGPGISGVTATSLTVTVPAGTGTVSVTVTTTAGGSSSPLASAYTYNGSTSPGGTVSLSKVTALIGNSPTKSLARVGPVTRPSRLISAPALRTVRRRVTLLTR